MPQQVLNQIHISEGGKRVLTTVKDELFPCINKLKDVLVSTQKIRISYQLYSPVLVSLEKEYIKICSEFFEIVRKLDTPDILFQGLQKNDQNIVAYFQFQEGFKRSIDKGLNYVEIIDRTLDRKTQNIQNNRTFLISVLAIVISVLSVIWSPNLNYAGASPRGSDEITDSVSRLRRDGYPSRGQAPAVSAELLKTAQDPGAQEVIPRTR